MKKIEKEGIRRQYVVRKKRELCALECCGEIVRDKGRRWDWKEESLYVNTYSKSSIGSCLRSC